MCKASDKTMILTKLHPNFEFCGVIMRMPTGKHKFIPFGCFTHESGMIMPTPKMNNDAAFTKFKKILHKVSILHSHEGVIVEEIKGNREYIWARKSALDNHSLESLDMNSRKKAA